MKRWLMAVTLAVTLLPTVGWAAEQNPQELIKGTANDVLSRLSEEKDRLKDNPQAIYDLIKDRVLPQFDFERMSRWVLGKYWRRADEGQKERFMEEFRNLLVRTYATSLLDYTDQKIEYLPLREDPSSGEVTVRSEIAQPGAFPVPVHYTLYKTDDGRWLVYDLSIDGVSLVANYRSSFAKTIRAEGLDGLIDNLAQRNQQGLDAQG